MDVHDTSSNVSLPNPTSTTDFSVIHASFIKTVASLKTELFEPFIHNVSESERKALSTLKSFTPSESKPPSESELKIYNQMKELSPRFYNEIREKLFDSFQVVTLLENITVKNSSLNILNPSYHCFNHNDPSQQQNPNVSYHRTIGTNNFTNFQKKALSLFMKCGFTKQKAKKIVQAIGEKSSCLQYYKYFWRNWYKWCQDNSVHYLDCSSFEFLNFLQQFAQGRQPATVNGCCVAICFVIKHAGGSVLAFKAPVIKAYKKSIISKPKTIISFQQEPSSNATSTHKANMDQGSRIFHNSPSHDCSFKSYSNPSCKESSPVSTIKNGDSSPNNQESSTQLYLSSLSENSLENKNIEIPCNSLNTLNCSLNITDSLIDICVNREDDNSQNSTNNSPITPTGPYVFSPFQENIIATFSDQGFTRKLAENVVQKIGTNEKCLNHYKGHWNRWYKWCHNHAINHLCFSAEELLQYLQNNKADGNKSKPATIKTRFSALYNIITKTGMSTETFRAPLIRLYLKQIHAQIKETVCCQHNSTIHNVVNLSEQIPPKKIKLESSLSSDILNSQQHNSTIHNVVNPSEQVPPKKIKLESSLSSDILNSQQHNSTIHNVVNPSEQVPPKKIKLESYLSSDILNFL